MGEDGLWLCSYGEADPEKVCDLRRVTESGKGRRVLSLIMCFRAKDHSVLAGALGDIDSRT